MIKMRGGVREMRGEGAKSKELRQYERRSKERARYERRSGSAGARLPAFLLLLLQNWSKVRSIEVFLCLYSFVFAKASKSREERARGRVDESKGSSAGVC